MSLTQGIEGKQMYAWLIQQRLQLSIHSIHIKFEHAALRMGVGRKNFSEIPAKAILLWRVAGCVTLVRRTSEVKDFVLYTMCRGDEGGLEVDREAWMPRSLDGEDAEQRGGEAF